MSHRLATAVLPIFLGLVPACGGDAAPTGNGGAGGAIAASTTATTSPASTSTLTSTGQGGCGDSAQGGAGGSLAGDLVANAGESQTVEPGDVVTLHGSAASTRCGAALEFAWHPTIDSAVTLDDPGSPTPTFTAPLQSTTLDFSLVVTDDEGQTAKSDVTITVGHAAPTAHAGTDRGALDGATLTLAGSGADPADLPLTFQWQQISGPLVALASATTATPSFALPPLLTGPLVFALTVNNGYHDSPPDWITVRRLDGADTDGDLLEDAQEITVGTAPEDADSDHDGIPDGWEVLGHEDVDYPALGCDPRHRDLLVELAVQEYTTNGLFHSARPSPDLLGKVMDFYSTLPLKNPDGLDGVALRFVDGPILPEGFVCSSPGGPVQGVIHEAPGNFLYREAFHKLSLCDGAAIDCADLGGRRIAMTFDAASNNDLAAPSAYHFYRVFIHEMGHNLGLGHGGGDPLNNKPNYPSLMNYGYYGDATTETFATGKVAFSHGVVPPLDECAIVEQGIFAGLAPQDIAFLPGYGHGKGWSVAADGSVDWDHDGTVSSAPYVRVLRVDPGLTPDCALLLDNDDFVTLDAGFAASLPTGAMWGG